MKKTVQNTRTQVRTLSKIAVRKKPSTLCWTTVVSNLPLFRETYRKRVIFKL